MDILLIFAWVIAAFVAMAFWEAYIEGKHPWAGAGVGWKLKIGKKYTSSFHRASNLPANEKFLSLFPPSHQIYRGFSEGALLSLFLK